MTGETWDYSLLPAVRGAQLPWAGVRVGSTLQRQRVRGLRLEMDYLTLSRSNVAAIVTRVINLTAAPFSGVLVTQAYLAPAAM